jgi:antibiotic biosynthesis monooxygenase (ABM) superfamily enzyme
MNKSSDSASLYRDGATVVVTHKVRNDKHAEYEEWMNEISPLCKAATGHLDWHVIRPIRGVTDTYTVIIRFDTKLNLKAWMESESRANLIDKALPYLVVGDDFVINSGLDFLFSPESEKVKPPIRWKQYLVTWSAIYPLALIAPLFTLPLLRRLGIPENHYLDALLVTGVVVFLMVYVVMPRYTSFIKKWLFE